MEVLDRRLHDSPAVSVRRIAVRPDNDACGAFEAAPADQLVLPVSGVFARHDGPRRQIIGSAGQALLFAAGAPYRISYPGAIGDEVLVLQYGRASWRDALCAVGDDVQDVTGAGLATHAMLPAVATLRRGLLRRALLDGAAGALKVEELACALLHDGVRACRRRESPRVCGARSATLERRRAQVERVKDAIAREPQRAWRLDELAAHAGASLFHLARNFSELVGLPIHRYQLQVRLARSLDDVLEPGSDLLDIALRHGFGTHSHFTALFRGAFGTTPSALRRLGAPAVADLCRNAARRCGVAAGSHPGQAPVRPGDPARAHGS